MLQPKVITGNEPLTVEDNSLSEEEKKKEELRQRFLRATRKVTEEPRKRSLVQILSTYVPQLVHQRLSKHDTDKAICENLVGVVLFTGNQALIFNQLFIYLSPFKILVASLVLQNNYQRQVQMGLNF
jgi:hypothetical protein